ncbi:hypothetical protein EVAR_14289_1 [Eumeta japonica]|uniref:Uncharacterized protein n=1 Tax=Eumeta variegata TaxID=151549 RepID=A0A4C1UM06_EUMVA|nr:hypothetical protein EVAR_14289_1 [Eumeta japonica]
MNPALAPRANPASVNEVASVEMSLERNAYMSREVERHFECVLSARRRRRYSEVRGTLATPPAAPLAAKSKVVARP